MSFAIVPAHDVPLAEQAAIANRGFAGYVAGWTDLDAGGLARFVCLQGADLVYSRFVRVQDQLAGFGYINRTGNIPRLAGMAIAAEARGTGAAAHLLQHLIEEARARDDRAMMLEVIEQNPRAHRFYQRHGFQDVEHLVGWRTKNDASETAHDHALDEIPLIDALKIPVANDYPDLPWQITRHAAAKLIAARAFRSGNVCVITSDPATTPIRVHSFLSPSLDFQEERNALGAIMRQYSNREFFAPAVFPEIFGREIFAPLGFHQEPISQFLMRLDF